MKRMVVTVGSGAAKALAAVAGAGFEVTLVAVDSDLQTLKHTVAPVRFQLGRNTLRGLGASDPEVARETAERDSSELGAVLAGYDHVVVVVGLGGGTGTGAAPVLCRVAGSNGARLTAVVLAFEGKRRRRQAEEGLEALRAVADEVVVVDVQSEMASRAGLTMSESFGLVDARIAVAVRSALGCCRLARRTWQTFADLAPTAGHPDQVQVVPTSFSVGALGRPTSGPFAHEEPPLLYVAGSGGQ